jgi:glycosyltransferase involved in cell wall biosynthesis
LSNLPKPFDTPDLVVFHETYQPKYIKLYKQLEKRNIPYVLVAHGEITKGAQSTKKIKKIIGNVLLFNRFASHARAIHFLSEHERQNTGIKSLRKMPHIIQSNGIDIIGQQKNNFVDGALRIIYVGRVSFEAKGIDIVLRVANDLKKMVDGQPVLITIAGTSHQGGLERAKAYVKRNHLEDIVSIRDAVYDNDKISMIIQNDCFIQLSRNEGQPLGLLEAMEIGMPTIVTPGTTFYEIVRDNKIGFSVQPNPKEIASLLISLSNNKRVLKGMPKRASSYIKEHYNWTAIGRDTIKKYRDLVKNVESKK